MSAGDFVLNQTALNQLSLGSLALGDPDLVANNTQAVFVGDVDTTGTIGAVELNALAGNDNAVVAESGFVLFRGAATFDSLATRSVGFTIIGLPGANPGIAVTTLGDLSLSSNVDGVDGPASIRGDNVVLRDGATLTSGGAIALSSVFGSPDFVSTFPSGIIVADDDPSISNGVVTIEAVGDMTFNAFVSPAGPVPGGSFPDAAGAPLGINSGGMVTLWS